MALSFFEWLTLSPKEQILVNHFDQQQEEMLKKQMRVQQAAAHQQQEQAFYAANPELYKEKLRKEGEASAHKTLFIGTIIFFTACYFLWDKTSVIKIIFSILSALCGLIFLATLIFSILHIQPKQIETDSIDIKNFVKQRYSTFKPRDTDNEIFEIVYENAKKQTIRQTIEYIDSIYKPESEGEKLYVIAYSRTLCQYRYYDPSRIISLKDSSGTVIPSPQTFFAGRVLF